MGKWIIPVDVKTKEKSNIRFISSSNNSISSDPIHDYLLSTLIIRNYQYIITVNIDTAIKNGVDSERFKKFERNISNLNKFISKHIEFNLPIELWVPSTDLATLSSNEIYPPIQRAVTRNPCGYIETTSTATKKVHFSLLRKI